MCAAVALAGPPPRRLGSEAAVDIVRCAQKEVAARDVDEPDVAPDMRAPAGQRAVSAPGLVPIESAAAAAGEGAPADARRDRDASPERENVRMSLFTTSAPLRLSGPGDSDSGAGAGH